MHFTSFLENGRLTVALTGEIDHHCAKQYIQAIAAKIEAYTPELCILDFEDVTLSFQTKATDASGASTLIAASSVANAMSAPTDFEPISV